MDVVELQQKHFVLVHGACHGAWCWFKLKPLLEAAGHRVTTLDLSAAGINTRNIQELASFYDFTLPLLEFMATVPADKKVILVGHSLGGLNIALAMDYYPEKILLAVFLNAFMPDTMHAPSYVFEQYMERIPRDAWLDTKFQPYVSPDGPETYIFFGPQYSAHNLYQQSSTEDFELAKLLLRPTSLFLNNLSKAKNLSKEGYGSVKRAYITGTQDKSIPPDFQGWLIENIGVSTVKEVKDADHMAMISKPKQLCQILLEISGEYSSN